MYTRAVDLKRLKFIAKHIKHLDPKKSKVLDIGCGNGNISIYLGSLGFNVLGVDISDKAVDKAMRLNTLENVSFKVMSAEDLIATGPSYDAVICSEVLEHLEDPGRLLKVINILLKPEGKLIVTVPNGFGPREMLMTKPMQWMQRKNNIWWRITKKIKTSLGYDGKTVQSDADDLEHIQFFTKKQLINLSSRNNFFISAFENTDFIEDLFPFSLASKRISVLQKFDCKIADLLPHQLTGGFHTVWEKSAEGKSI